MDGNNILVIRSRSARANFYDFDESYTTTNQILEAGRTFLSWSIRKANLYLIKDAVQKGANVNEREKGGATPLLVATHLNRLDVVKFLIEKGARIDESDSYETPLMVAVRKGYLPIVKFLVEKGANINAVSIEGISPIFWAIKQNEADILNSLLNKRNMVNVFDPSGNSPLMFAIENCSSKKIIQCLLQNGAEITESPLAWAAKDGRLEVIEILIKYGADVNLEDLDGNTPIATATMYKQMEVVRYLVSQNANICKVGRNGKPPLLWAIKNNDVPMIEFLLEHGSEYIIDNVFIDAIASKNLQIVHLLREKGACKIKNQKILLAKALEVQSFEIAKYLIEIGTGLVDLGNEITYMMKFLEEKNHEMVILLTENGARLNKFGSDGHTPLTKSIQMEEFEMVQYFIQKGADINQRNKTKLAPLDLAAIKKNFRIFQYLVDSGANVFTGTEENSRFFQIAEENRLKREKLLTELISNQEEGESDEGFELAEDEEISVGPEINSEEMEAPERSLAERNYYIVEFY